MAVARKSANGVHPIVEIGRKWLDRIRASEKREEEWRKQARKAENIYLNKTEGGANRVFFNILHSNIETIVPAIYSQTPRPDIRRRFGDPDPIAKTAATMIERAILVQIDDGALDPEMEALAWSALTPGRGVIRVRLVEEDALTGAIDDEVLDETEEAAKFDAENAQEAAAEGGEDDPQETPAGQIPPPGEVPKLQRITFESVGWNDFRFGAAKRWEDVPWVAFRHTITGEQIKAWKEDEGVQAQIKSVSSGAVDDPENDKEGAVVWEIWCKSSKTVKFIRDGNGVVFKTVDDPLGLTGFFPCGKPVQQITRQSDMMPVAPFELYADLAEELDKTTRRIQKLIEGIKVKGGAAAGEMFRGIKDIADLGDNEIVEIRGVEAFAQQGGLEKAIMWWPIEKSLEAIQALAQHREQIKAIIYEVTGISDIIRGTSQSQETATAQQIKSQWGSLRIQKLQRLIERSVRDVFVMCAELIATRFTPDTLQAITGIQYSPEIDAIFRNRVNRFYRIDIETDSTIKADMSKSKSEMTEFLQGTAAYIQAVGPAVQEGMMPAPLAVEIYSAFARTFRLGKQAEDALDKLSQEAQQPQEPKIPPEVQQQLEQSAQLIQQLEQENAQLKADKSAEMASLQMKQQAHVQEMDIRQQEHALNMVSKQQQMDLAAAKSLQPPKGL